MKFAPGEVLVRRHWRGGRVTLMQVVRVAGDDEQGLRLWLPSVRRLGGSPKRPRAQAAIDQLAVLPRGTAARRRHAVDAGEKVLLGVLVLGGRHVRRLDINLEEPYVRWADRGCAGVDTADQCSDVSSGRTGRGGGGTRTSSTPDRPSALLDRGPGDPDPRPSVTGSRSSSRRRVSVRRHVVRVAPGRVVDRPRSAAGSRPAARPRRAPRTTRTDNRPDSGRNLGVIRVRAGESGRICIWVSTGVRRPCRPSPCPLYRARRRHQTS